MTYYDYTNSLVNELSKKMNSTKSLYDKLKGSKQYLNEFEMKIYKDAVNDYNCTADEITKLQYSILNGNVNLLDEMN